MALTRNTQVHERTRR